MASLNTIVLFLWTSIVLSAGEGTVRYGRWKGEEIGIFHQSNAPIVINNIYNIFPNGNWEAIGAALTAVIVITACLTCLCISICKVGFAFKCNCMVCLYDIICVYDANMRVIYQS